MLLHEDWEQLICVPLKRLDIWGLKNLYVSRLSSVAEARERDTLIATWKRPLLKCTSVKRKLREISRMHFICLSTTVKYCNAFIKIKDMASHGRLSAHLQLEKRHWGWKKDIQRKKKKLRCLTPCITEIPYEKALKIFCCL